MLFDAYSNRLYNYKTTAVRALSNKNAGSVLAQRTNKTGDAHASSDEQNLVLRKLNEEYENLEQGGACTTVGVL